MPRRAESRIARGEEAVGVVAVDKEIEPAPGEFPMPHEVHPANDRVRLALQRPITPTPQRPGSPSPPSAPKLIAATPGATRAPPASLRAAMRHRTCEERMT